jgi:hypothetical protein
MIDHCYAPLAVVFNYLVAVPEMIAEVFLA